MTMKLSKRQGKLVSSVAIAGAIMVVCLLNISSCKAQGSSWGASRPSSPLFEPTLSFMRQNLRLMNSYVALFRSIFVGAYERPLVTSTDSPNNVGLRQPPPKVPPMDLPRASLARQ